MTPTELRLDTIVDVIRWGGSAEVFVPWRDHYAEVMTRRLAEVLARNPGLAAQLEALPPFIQRTAPLDMDVLRECVRASGREAVEQALESFVDVASRRRPLPARMLPFGTPADGQPLLVVDDVSPDVLAREGISHLRRVAIERRDQGVSRLRGAGAFIERVSAELPAFVATFITQLWVCEDARPLCFSGSFEWMPGVAYVSNIHLVSLLKIAELLVHEAIHGALYMFEVTTHPLLASPADEPLPSSWTQVMLRPAAYVQACFVWYGIAHLWRRGHELEPGPRTLRPLQRAIAGFLRSPVSGAHQQPLRRWVDERTWQCLLAIERDMQTEAWEALGRA